MMFFCVFCVLFAAVICAAAFLKVESLNERLNVETSYSDGLLEDLEEKKETIFKQRVELEELEERCKTNEQALGDALTTNLERAEDVAEIERNDDWDDAYEALSELDK